MKPAAKAIPKAPVDLREYQRKRRFSSTPEPAPAKPRLAVLQPPAHASRRFCVQQHSASHLHYDLRLEIADVLKSWAVPKGPSMDPEVCRLAIATEDHPLDYLTFEGAIPEGNYGAGEVILWDLGEYEPLGDVPPLRQWKQGYVKFRLHGKKLRGEFVLTSMPSRHGASENSGIPPENAWLLIKKHDEAAHFGDSAEQHPGSVLHLPRRSRSSAAEPHLLPSRPPRSQPRPMLATLATQPFRDPNWLFELKWDGIRAFAHACGGSMRLVSRYQRDLTRQYPELAAFPAPLDAVLDGEIVALDADGKPSFHRLQRRMNLIASAGIARLSEQMPVVFYAFDLLSLAGQDLTPKPLQFRKAQLAALPWSGPWRYSDHVVGNGAGLYELARRHGLEGIVAKRTDSPYEAGRSRLWLKFKLQQRQDAVIVGFTDPQGSRTSIGALLLAVFEPELRRYVYVGKVGTGFDTAARAALLHRLQAAARTPSAAALAGLDPPPPRFHPVPPQLVVEVKFAEWTPGGHLRAPVYLGLRTDKAPQECLREVPRA
ncbi:MAG: non-homologous end-joining DNA ligase [Terriglobales bacterium]